MRKQKSSPIPDQTRNAILEAAWTLLASGGSKSASQSDIAAQAGVSRQTVYLAFGNRTELLTAILRHRDESSENVKRMQKAAQSTAEPLLALLAFADAWLDYLPEIYPVGIRLHAESLTDPVAAEAWRDRIEGGLLRGLLHICKRISRETGQIPANAVTSAAEEVWSLVHPATWQLLVVERGWSPMAFRKSRHAAIRRLLAPDKTQPRAR